MNKTQSQLTPSSGMTVFVTITPQAGEYIVVSEEGEEKYMTEEQFKLVCRECDFNYNVVYDKIVECKIPAIYFEEALY